MKTTRSDNIVIVGGGAGGLELACKLGRKLGRERVTLVDHAFYHIWKPSLHEVAAGTMDLHKEGLPYAMLAYQNDFTFVYGSFAGLDAGRREITVAAVQEDGFALMNQIIRDGHRHSLAKAYLYVLGQPFKKAWKRRVAMGALGAGAGLLVGALVHGIVAVTRPELQGEISWRLLGCSCCGGALCAFIESWKR